MDCLDQHAVQTRFYVDIAEGPQSHAAIGIETMQEALRRFAGQGLADHPKHFRRDGFELKASPVSRFPMFRLISPAGLYGVRQ